MRSVLIPLTDGFEEIEAIATIDILRRAEMEVYTAGFERKAAKGKHHVTVETDILFAEVDPNFYDAIVIPGGPGHKNLKRQEGLSQLLRQFDEEKKWIAAICAGPTVLANIGLLEGRKATCFPDAEGDMDGAQLSHDEVVVDGHFITSRGAGTAIPFALKIVELLIGAEKAEEVGKRIVFQTSPVA